ncbi:unnamed protein product [Ascophyllum nodosum]
MYNIIFNSSTKRARQTQQVKATWRRSAVSGLVLAATPLFWGIEALVRSQVVTTTTAHLPNFTTTGETIHEERRQEVVLQADSSSRTHRSLAAFSTVEESTILFLHVFKCAGTSLRYVLLEWAHREGWSGVEVEECRNPQFWMKASSKLQKKRVCLDTRNDLLDPARQRWKVASQKLIAGHFLWGFRKYVRQPYLMITTLRQPLELFVSAQQFIHRDKTRTLEEAIEWVSGAMTDRIRWRNSLDIGFIRRFLEDGDHPFQFIPTDASSLQQAQDLAASAIEHLNTFFVVGVVEQYSGFIEVLKLTLDPEVKHPELWSKAVEIKNNGSPVRSGDVLQQIDPSLVKEFNSTVLELQWQVYSVALQLWDSRCREVLPREQHDDLCTVL